MYNKYGYIIIERCADPYFGPEATRFFNKKYLVEYLKDNRDYLSDSLISILKISKDVTSDFDDILKVGGK